MGPLCRSAFALWPDSLNMLCSPAFPFSDFEPFSTMDGVLAMCACKPCGRGMSPVYGPALRFQVVMYVVVIVGWLH